MKAKERSFDWRRGKTADVKRALCDGRAVAPI